MQPPMHAYKALRDNVLSRGLLIGWYVCVCVYGKKPASHPIEVFVKFTLSKQLKIIALFAIPLCGYRSSLTAAAAAAKFA